MAPNKRQARNVIRIFLVILRRQGIVACSRFLTEGPPGSLFTFSTSEDRVILGPLLDVLTAELTDEKTPDPAATRGLCLLRCSSIREESKHHSDNSYRAGATVGER